jgi:hypothetical protein
MGVNTYPCEDCNECFYSAWAVCEMCNIRCDEFMNKLICNECFDNEQYDTYKLYCKNETYHICQDCINVDPDCLIKNIKNNQHNHEKTNIPNLEELKDAILEHKECHENSSNIKACLINEIIILMERNNDNFKLIDILCDKINNVL